MAYVIICVASIWRTKVDLQGGRVHHVKKSMWTPSNSVHARLHLCDPFCSPVTSITVIHPTPMPTFRNFFVTNFLICSLFDLLPVFNNSLHTYMVAFFLPSYLLFFIS